LGKFWEVGDSKKTGEVFDGTQKESQHLLMREYRVQNAVCLQSIGFHRNQIIRIVY